MGPDAFDFWLGEWNCATEAGSAINSITQEYSGRVLVERFTVLGPPSWSGMSTSVYSPHDGWRQTWVDQDGNYWALRGCLVDGDPCFATDGPVDSDQLFKRMVFSDIGPESLHWRWETSPDESVWTPRLTAAYTRRSAANRDQPG
ncbi:MAG: hypothetical protein OEW30_03895 [Acidimicrobiia bacterium]|nr:hypothetical protein [Acidimicrobiia bacterium]MDH5294290.1 hypothetical protein [Acidimicrobiia bacterium]